MRISLLLLFVTCVQSTLIVIFTTKTTFTPAQGASFQSVCDAEASANGILGTTSPLACLTGMTLITEKLPAGVPVLTADGAIFASDKSTMLDSFKLIPYADGSPVPANHYALTGTTDMQCDENCQGWTSSGFMIIGNAWDPQPAVFLFLKFLQPTPDLQHLLRGGDNQDLRSNHNEPDWPYHHQSKHEQPNHKSYPEPDHKSYPEPDHKSYPKPDHKSYLDQPDYLEPDNKSNNHQPNHNKPDKKSDNL